MNYIRSRVFNDPSRERRIASFYKDMVGFEVDNPNFGHINWNYQVHTRRCGEEYHLFIVAQEKFVSTSVFNPIEFLSDVNFRSEIFREYFSNLWINRIINRELDGRPYEVDGIEFEGIKFREAFDKIVNLPITNEDGHRYIFGGDYIRYNIGVSGDKSYRENGYKYDIAGALLLRTVKKTDT